MGITSPLRPQELSNDFQTHDQTYFTNITKGTLINLSFFYSGSFLLSFFPFLLSELSLLYFACLFKETRVLSLRPQIPIKKTYHLTGIGLYIEYQHSISLITQPLVFKGSDVIDKLLSIPGITY